MKTTLKGEVVWKIQGPPDIEAYGPAPTARRSATTRRTSRSRRTATSTSATATARTTSISTTARRSTSARSAARERRPGKLAEPHGIWVDTRAAQPGPRRRRSAQQPAAALHARRPAHRLRPGLPAALPLRRTEGHGRHSRPARPRDADRQRQQRHRAPRRLERPRTGTTRCARSRATTFIPGQFICPHGACFDHAGNIFVVEWVEVGRVTKLRKV